MRGVLANRRHKGYDFGGVGVFKGIDGRGKARILYNA
jgi:hypothetical protein